MFGSLITSACGSFKKEGANYNNRRLFLSWQVESLVLDVKIDILQKIFGVTITQYYMQKNGKIGNGEF